MIHSSTIHAIATQVRNFRVAVNDLGYSKNLLQKALIQSGLNGEFELFNIRLMPFQVIELKEAGFRVDRYEEECYNISWKDI